MQEKFEPSQETLDMQGLIRACEEIFADAEIQKVLMENDTSAEEILLGLREDGHNFEEFYGSISSLFEDTDIDIDRLLREKGFLE